MESKRPFSLISGLHSDSLLEELENMILNTPDICDYYDPRPKDDIRILTTKTGDTVIHGNTYISENDYYIVQQFTSDQPEELMALCMLAEHLKKNHANSITLIAPVFKPGWPVHYGSDTENETISEKIINAMLASSGLDRIVTFTPPPVLFSSTLPVKIVTPGYYEQLKEQLLLLTNRECVVYSYEPHLAEKGAKLAECLNCSFHMHNSFIDFNSLQGIFSDKAVLIYSDGPYYPHLERVACKIKDTGAAEVYILLPCLDVPEQLASFDYNKIDTVFHLRGLSKNQLPIHFTKRINDCDLIKAWIISDRAQSKMMEQDQDLALHAQEKLDLMYEKLLGLTPDEPYRFVLTVILMGACYAGRIFRAPKANEYYKYCETISHNIPVLNVDKSLLQLPAVEAVSILAMQCSQTISIYEEFDDLSEKRNYELLLQGIQIMQQSVLQPGE